MEARSYPPHYTVDDYRSWPGDWELWHGNPVSMSPSPTYRHQNLLAELARCLGNQLAENSGCRCDIVVEHDWHVANDHVVRPDLMVVYNPFEGDFLDRPPTLAAEILSPATAHKDRSAKRDLYAQQGVAAYLLVDPDAGSIKTLTLTDDGSLEPAAAAGDLTPVTLHDGCTLQIPAGLG